MTPDTRVVLLRQLSEAEERARALAKEAKGLWALKPREAFGNPFSYSHPKVASEGEANFTGYSSHSVTLPTVQELMRVGRRIQELKAQIAALD